MNLTKKILVITLFVCFILFAQLKSVYAADIPIFVDNVPAHSEVSPFYSKDNLLVPARLISEELGASVDWDGKQVTIKGQDINIILYMGKNEASVNGINQKLAAPLQIIQGRLFVPLRFIGEALNAKVLYRDQKVFLYSPQFTNQVNYVPNKFQRGENVYTLDGNCEIKKNGTILPIEGKAKALLAVSNSGLVYANNSVAESNVSYYNFANQKSVKLYDNYSFLNVNNNNPLFTDNGNFYYMSFAQSKKANNKSGAESVVYYAIFARDIDGANQKEIFVEEANYQPYSMMLHDGWIYYINRTPVVQSYGIDYYAGALYRVRTDGTGRQRLTEEEHVSGNFSISNDGISYEYGSDAKKGFLRFADMK